jgi:3-deoxy-D-manno-octulosonic-acid transferase
MLEAKETSVPLALVNARMSPSSLKRWLNWRAAGQQLTRVFSFASAADARTAEALTKLRGVPVANLGNLKLAAPPPAADPAARAALSEEIGARPVWLAASTHAGEDEIALAAHAYLRQTTPDALLIIAPRHPERGAAIAALADKAPRRSRFEHIGAAPVYVADTLGELGLLYESAPVALVAGSLLPALKGHNPIEPAKLGAAILTGPNVESFQDVFDALIAARGASVVTDAESLAAEVRRLWSDASARENQTNAARGVAAHGAQAFADTVDALIARLPAPQSARKAADASA